MKLKNVLLTVLSFVLVAAVAIGGTLAYLTSEDSDVNVMTLGNVEIEQIEQERNAAGELVEFTQAKPVYPAVYEGDSIPYAEPAKYPVANDEAWKVVEDNANVVDKFVTVKNTGKSEAYVRTIIAFEVTEDYSNNSKYMHLNCNNNDKVSFDWENVILVTDDGGYYWIGVFTYVDALAPNETTIPSLKQIYLDKTATNEVCAAYGETFDIFVLSQAVQTEGFANAKAALDAGFGEVNADNIEKWFDGAKAPTLVSTADELKAAIAASEKDIIVKGAEISEKLSLGSDVNTTFVDCTITGNNAWGYVNNATFSNCTFDSGLANAAIHFDRLYGDAIFNNCEFVSGRVQIGTNGTGTVTFNDCTFAETTQTHSIWTEMGIRVYKTVEFNNCEFNNRVVMAGSNGQSVTFNSCTTYGNPVVYINGQGEGSIIRGGNVPTVTINN